jgi:tetratricopeptide (TPR) repeat protein
MINVAEKLLQLGYRLLDRQFEHSLLVAENDVIDVQEMCDAVWLAALGLKPTIVLDSSTPGRIESEPKQQQPQHRSRNIPEGLDTSLRQPSSPQPLSPQPSSPQPTQTDVGIHSPNRRQSGSGQRIRISGAPAIGRRLEIDRSLRPLRCRLPTRYQLELDVDATITAICETRRCVSIFSPARNRWLDIVLVVEKSPTMRLWQETANEWRDALLRGVAPRKLSSLEAEWTTSGLSLKNHVGSIISPRSLAAPGRSTLIVYLSDAVGPGWMTAQVPEQLQRWTKNAAVVFVQVLPPQLWGFSSLHRGMPIRNLVHSRGRSWHNGVGGLRGVLVCYLSPDDIAKVAIHLSTRKAATTAVLPQDSKCYIDQQFDRFASAANFNAAQIPSEEIDQIYEEFIRFGSLQSRQVAQHIACIPEEHALTLPLMRLVQRTLVSDAVPWQFAEIFLSGLMYRDRRYEESTNPTFDFVGNIRQRLRADAGQMRRVETRVLVSRYLREREGKGAMIDVVVPTDKKSPDGLAIGKEPIATIPKAMVEMDLAMVPDEKTVINSITSTFFISTVTNEFGSLRTAIRDAIDRSGVRVEVQEHFLPFGDRTLLELDKYIQCCDAVVQLSGRMTGSAASPANRKAILDLYKDLPERLQLSAEMIESLSYTQWEAWLAVYHGKRLYIAPARPNTKVDQPLSDSKQIEQQAGQQAQHLQALRTKGYHPSDKLAFSNQHELVIGLLRTLQDLLPPVTVPISPELPPSLGSLFKGRDDKLADIKQAFEKAHPRGAFDISPVAIWGMGGLGKTRLATEYAQMFAHQHEALLFVSAATKEDLENSLANLCGVLRLDARNSTEREYKIESALRWLDDPIHSSWLLIIDNVDDRDSLIAVEQRLRTLHRGRVILTGRLRDWPMYVTPIHLEVLSTKHATEFLLDYTEKRRVPDAGGPEADRAQAAALANELGCLALALTQAACSIRKRGQSFSEYLIEWNTNRDELLDDPEFDPMIAGYPRTMAVTVKTSYKQLPPLSAFLFEALCWLAPDPIPERLVSQPWPESVQEWLTPELRNLIPRRRADLLIPLYDFCLAEGTHSTDRFVVINRVVQYLGRRWQRSESNDEILQRVRVIAALVKADFVRPETAENGTLHILQQLRQQLPHVEALVAHELVTECTKSWLLRTSSEVLWTQGLNIAARNNAEAAVECGRQALSSDASAESRLVLVRSLSHLVLLLGSMQKIAEAVNLVEELLQLSSGYDRDSVIKHSSARSEVFRAVGRVRESQGQLDEALSLFDESRRISETMRERDPGNLAHQRHLGIALEDMGRVREKKGELDKALSLFDESRRISETLCERDPENLAHQRDLGISLNYVGRVRESQGQLDEALSLFDHSRKISETLCERDPGNLAHQRDLGIVLNNVGRVREKKGGLDDALSLFDQCRKIRESLCEQEPENLAHQRELGISLNNIGRVREAKGELDEALLLFDESLKISEMLCERDPGNLAHKRELGIAFNHVGRVRENLRQLDEAASLFDRSREIIETLCEQEPENFFHKRELGIALNSVGRVRENLGQLNEALSLFDQSRRIIETLCEREPGNLAHQWELGIALNNVGRVCESQGQWDEALWLFDESRKIRETLCEREPGNLAHQRELGIALLFVAGTLTKLKRKKHALISAEKAEMIFKNLKAQGAGFSDTENNLRTAVSRIQFARRKDN